MPCWTPYNSDTWNHLAGWIRGTNLSLIVRFVFVVIGSTIYYTSERLPSEAFRVYHLNHSKLCLLISTIVHPVWRKQHLRLISFGRQITWERLASTSDRSVKLFEDTDTPFSRIRAHRNSRTNTICLCCIYIRLIKQTQRNHERKIRQQPLKRSIESRTKKDCSALGSYAKRWMNGNPFPVFPDRRRFCLMLAKVKGFSRKAVQRGESEEIRSSTANIKHSANYPCMIDYRTAWLEWKQQTTNIFRLNLGGAVWLAIALGQSLVYLFRILERDQATQTTIGHIILVIIFTMVNLCIPEWSADAG